MTDSNPNLQNIPVHTEDGQKIGKLFGVEHEPASLDYSQIERYIMAVIEKYKANHIWGG
jgi:DNA polymerase I-like protein with 3'-5' exonuclease and polymerase domains